MKETLFTLGCGLLLAALLHAGPALNHRNKMNRTLRPEIQ